MSLHGENQGSQLSRKDGGGASYSLLDSKAHLASVAAQLGIASGIKLHKILSEASHNVITLVMRTGHCGRSLAASSVGHRGLIIGPEAEARRPPSACWRSTADCTSRNISSQSLITQPSRGCHTGVHPPHTHSRTPYGYWVPYSKKL
jgi:hypothetical protein